MRSKAAISVWLLSCLFMFLTACGRDDLASRCTSDGDCSADRMCVAGQCLDPGDIDAGEDADAQITCTTNDDCPGAGACFEEQGACVSSECVFPQDNEFGHCEPRPCVGDQCEPWEQADACGCMARQCQDASECNGYGCVGGECAPCQSDGDCADGDSCAADGTCVEGTTCAGDRDCPANQMCNDGMCVDRPECLIDSDCGDQEICLNGACTYSPDCQQDSDCDPGFECVGGQCFESICRGPDDCADGQFCDAGECVDPPEAASCFVAGQNAVISRNQQFRLEAFAVDQDGNGIPASFQWDSTNPAVADISANGQYAVGQGGTGTTTITASITGTNVQCDGEVVLTGQADVSPGDLRVVVIDAETGAGVSGADVVLSNGSSTTTNASGVATLSDPQGVYHLSVFANDYNYITVRDLQAVDVRIPLSHKRGTGPVAGFTGEFDLSQISSTGDITLGLAGASIAGGLLDLDLQRLLGEPFMTHIEIPGMGGRDMPLPGGLVMYGQVFGFDLDFKRNYYANTSGGARIGWGLAGKVPANRLIQMFRGGGGGNAGDVLTMLLPLFNRFDHGSQPLNLVEMPRVQDANDLDGDGNTTEMVPDYDSFPQVDLTPSVNQNLVTDVDVSNFPQMSGGPASVAVLVGGTILDGPGFVPLGISATNDQDGDGVPDTRRLTMAPPHGSLSGGRLGVVALAFEPNQVGFQNGVQLPDEFSAALWNGQSVPTGIGLGTFPDASQGTIDDSTRTVSVTADAGPVFRVRLVGAERTWDVWSKGAPGTQGTFTHQIVVPAAGAGHTDLFASSEIFVDAIAAQVTMDDLVRATGIGLRDAGLVATSFSRTKLR